MPLPGLLITAALAQSVPASQPTTSATIEVERIEHARLVEQEYNLLPRHEAMPIGKILGIQVEDGHLHVRPLLPPTAGAVRIDAPDWPGFLQVTVGDEKLLAFHLKHIDTKNPARIATYTQVITGPDYLQISRESEDDHGLESTTLIQSRQFADENDQPIRVTIRTTPEDTDKPPVEINMAGESFSALVQQHGQALRTYLLPILRDLGAADVLNSSTPTIAWQVLGDGIDPDPKMVSKIAELTRHLNADDFKTRAAAEDELATLGPEAAAVVRRQDLSALPLDPATALRMFRLKRETLPPGRAAELARDVPFLIDTLLLDDARLCRAAARQLAAVMGAPIDLPDDLPAAERARRVESLRQRFLPAGTQPAEGPRPGE